MTSSIASRFQSLSRPKFTPDHENFSLRSFSAFNVYVTMDRSELCGVYALL